MPANDKELEAFYTGALSLTTFTGLFWMWTGSLLAGVCIAWVLVIFIPAFSSR